MNPEISARLEGFHIRVMAEGDGYCMFVRDGCLGMAPRTADSAGFSGIGSTGMALDQGLAYLVWREGMPFLVGRGFELPASPEQVALIRRFSTDLQSALGVAGVAGAWNPTSKT